LGTSHEALRAILDKLAPPVPRGQNRYQGRDHPAAEHGAGEEKAQTAFAGY
jgi:hypothetical protein